MKGIRVILLYLLGVTPLFAQTTDLDDLRDRYEEHRQAIHQKYREGSIKKLHQQYLARLDELADAASGAGKLEAVLVIRKES